MLEQLSQSRLQRCRILDRRAGGPFETITNRLPVQLEYQVVCSQTRHVTIRVEALERIVEIVGQVDLVQTALPQNRLLPVRSRHHLRCTVVDRLPVVRSDPLTFESKELATHLNQPADLDRVVQMIEEWGKPGDQLPRLQTGLLNLVSW